MKKKIKKFTDWSKEKLIAYIETDRERAKKYKQMYEAEKRRASKKHLQRSIRRDVRRGHSPMGILNYIGRGARSYAKHTRRSSLDPWFNQTITDPLGLSFLTPRKRKRKKKRRR